MNRIQAFEDTVEDTVNSAFYVVYQLVGQHDGNLLGGLFFSTQRSRQRFHEARFKDRLMGLMPKCRCVLLTRDYSEYAGDTLRVQTLPARGDLEGVGFGRKEQQVFGSSSLGGS